MCNAWNHPPGCPCAWGPGNGRTGYHSIADYSINGHTVNWRYAGEDFCRPTTCPVCGASVFFVRYNGGSVWFDDLGKPWPKHACFDAPATPSVYYYSSEQYGWNSTEGIRDKLTCYSSGLRTPVFAVAVVVQSHVITFRSDELAHLNRVTYNIVLWCATGTPRILRIIDTSNSRAENLVGEAAVVSRRDRKIIFLSTGREFPIMHEEVISDNVLGPVEIGELYEHPFHGICKLLSVQRVGDSYGVMIRLLNGVSKRLFVTASDLKLVLNYKGDFED